MGSAQPRRSSAENSRNRGKKGLPRNEPVVFLRSRETIYAQRPGVFMRSNNRITGRLGGTMLNRDASLLGAKHRQSRFDRVERYISSMPKTLINAPCAFFTYPHRRMFSRSPEKRSKRKYGGQGEGDWLKKSKTPSFCLASSPCLNQHVRKVLYLQQEDKNHTKKSKVIHRPILFVLVVLF